MLALMRTDFMRDIMAGRLKFLSPPDILKSGPADRKGFHLWPHPVLGPLYDWEKTLFASQAVTAGPYRRALVISGGLFSLDVSEALRDLGLEVFSWNPPCSEQQHILHEILLLDPHLIVSINYRHGLSEISSTLGIPLLVWEIDPSIERLAPLRVSHPDTYIYTYRKANIPRFREAGFEHVEYLPLAANPKRRYPRDLSSEEADQWGADVSFAGSSMAAQAEALRQLYLQLTQDRSFFPTAKTDDPVRDYASLWDTAVENQRRNPDRYVIEEAFREYFPQGSWVASDGEERLVDLAFCAAETAASKRRVQVLNTLSQLDTGFRIRVWGDDGWRRILPDNIQYRGPVGHFFELTSVYNASQINLDINRIYQRDIATMRVFDVLACRGFLLADWSDDLGDLFHPGSEVIAYRSLGEIPSLVRHFLTHPREREQIAEAGYQRVLREHTIQSRVECMLDHLP
jgi:spore maturation protein CgeB